MSRILIVLSMFWLCACDTQKQVPLGQIILTNLEGREVKIENSADSSILVIVFLSPDCPFCINYTKALLQIKDEFSGKNVRMLAVFPGQYYQEDEIIKFRNKYLPEIEGIFDPDYKLTNMVDATVTPEVVVVSRDGRIAYSGAIDNWAYDTGKKRPVATRFFLKDAIEKLLSDSTPEPSRTEPIGCFIE